MEMSALVASSEYHEAVDSLEKAMLSQPEALVDLPLVHHFVEGMYIREIFNPADTLITTRIHKTEHPYTILKGRLSIYEYGESVRHITAPHFGITKPGTRRVIYAHEDTVFITFHSNPDNETNIETLEARLFDDRDLIDGKTSHQLAIESLQQRLIREHV